MSKSNKKQHAAIMFTDIVNFTHYMSVDEKKSLSFLNEKKSQLSSLVKKYNGNYIKDIGDGTLTYYDNSNSALECALELHNVLSKKTGMNIRVGIHYGQFLKIKDDIYGDDVNIASRLEELSPAGGICVSNLFLNNLSKKKKIKTDYIGLQSFKGVGRLIDVYAINHKNLKRPQLSDYSNENIVIDHDEIPSIVLFPFINQGIQSDAFYAHSLSTDILTDLSNSSDIKSASFTEVDAMVKKRFKHSTIAKKLASRYYITGSFWKQKTKFNLSIELTDNQSKKIIWTDSWMEEWDSLNDIKNKLVNNIFKILSNKDKKEIEYDEFSNSDTESYKLYLKAKYIFGTRSSDKGYSQIETLLEKSISKDKRFVAPYLLFGEYYMARNKYNDSLKYFELGLDISLKNNNKINIGKSLNNIGKIYYLNGKLEKASEYYNKAMQIWDKTNYHAGKADTLNVIGAVHDYNGRYKDALKHYKDSYASYDIVNDKIGLCKTSFNIANVFCTMGELENALKYQEISFTLSKKTNNSLSIANNYNLRGVLYSNSHRYQEAYELFKKALKIKKELNDEEGIGALYRNIGVVYLHMGLLKQSIDYFNRSLMICKDVGHNILNCHLQLAKAYKQMGIYENSINHYEKSIQIISQTVDEDRLSITINKLANLYIKMGLYETALKHYARAEKIKLKIKDKLGMGYTFLGMARVKSWMGEYDNAITLLDKTINIGNLHNEYILIADAKFYLSFIYLNKNNYTKSMELIDEAINLANEQKICDRSAKFFDCKGLIYKFMGNLDAALEMHEKALLLSREINDKHGIRQYLNNKGLIFEERAKFEEAMEIYAECLSLSKQMNEKRSICVSYCNIGYILDYQGALKQSLKYFTRAYKLARDINYKAGVGGYAHNMAQIYIKEKEYKKAIVLFNSSYKILNDLGIIDKISCLIGKVYCYWNMGNNDFTNDLKKIEALIVIEKSYYDYKGLWQLHKLYKSQNMIDLSEQYLAKAHSALIDRTKHIPTDHDKDYFLNTYDAQNILKEIN